MNGMARLNYLMYYMFIRCENMKGIPCSSSSTFSAEEHFAEEDRDRNKSGLKSSSEAIFSGFSVSVAENKNFCT